MNGRTGTSRSHTSNIVSKWMTENVWCTTSHTLRLSGFQSSLPLIASATVLLRRRVAQKLSDIWRSTCKIDATQPRSVTEIAQKSSSLWVTRSRCSEKIASENRYRAKHCKNNNSVNSHCTLGWRPCTYVIMAVDPACHTMVDPATNHCGICSWTNLKTSDTIIVYIITFVITLWEKRRYFVGFHTG